MKTQITKKAIMNAYRNVIKVGYCDMQDALKWREPNFYTAGVYGWNADVYVIDCDTVIVTGYRPFGNTELSRAQIHRSFTIYSQFVNTFAACVCYNIDRKKEREVNQMETKIHEYVYSEHENYITGKELLEMSGAKIWAETESETIYTIDDAIYIIEWRKSK